MFITMTAALIGTLAAITSLASRGAARTHGAWPRVRRGAAALAVAAVLVVVDALPRPLLDDGPFEGRAVAQPTTGIAQTVALGTRFTLLNYDPQPGQPEPVVCLVRGPDRLRAPLWCVVASGHLGTQVTDLYFGSASLWAWNNVIDGKVSWTYGEERMMWLIGPFGGLRGYWYSW